MSSQPEPTAKVCPVCGVAMLASKSSKDRDDFDTFHCLRCNTVISLTPGHEILNVSGKEGGD
jgi:transposase